MTNLRRQEYLKESEINEVEDPFFNEEERKKMYKSLVLKKVPKKVKNTFGSHQEAEDLPLL